MSRQAEEAQRFSERVCCDVGMCNQCSQGHVPVAIFSTAAQIATAAVCADCLRAAVPLLKHYVHEEKRKCASTKKT